MNAVCVFLCVCARSQIEQRVYCDGESGRLYYHKRNSDYFPEWLCLHTCGRNFSGGRRGNISTFHRRVTCVFFLRVGQESHRHSNLYSKAAGSRLG